MNANAYTNAVENPFAGETGKEKKGSRVEAARAMLSRAFRGALRDLSALHGAHQESASALIICVRLFDLSESLRK